MEPNLIKAMDIFGGGLGAHGEVCGAVVGGLAALSLRHGRTNGEEQAGAKMWSCAFHFMKRFREEVAKGSILCRDIVNVNWMDPKQTKAYYEAGNFLTCVELVGKAARIVGEVLDFAETKK
jgi:C_GCAxxG_C_C family probable redox protein